MNIREYIEEEKPYLDSYFGVDQMVQELGVSNKTVQKKCWKQYRMTPKAVLREYRIKLAVKLIKNGYAGNFTELHKLCGYASTTSLYENFRKVHQCNPREYAKMIRNRSEILKPRLKKI